MPKKNAAPAAVSPPSRFVLSAGLDAVLFIGTPLLILPVVLLLHERWTSAQIYLFVASFGAVGHHLPGMLRAYGDRALFERFRLRFVAAPLFLLASCVWLAFHAKSALTLAVFAWGAWHGAMQIHGFARIYDAKAASISRLTARLDQALVLAWFLAVIVLSDVRTQYVLDHALRAGLPAPAPATIHAVRLIVGALTAALTLAWLARAAWQWRAGKPPSPVKLALLLTSIGFFAYANVAVKDLLLAVVLFEAFHDVQYLSIVWFFNRKRAAADPGAGAFTRALFRPRAGLLLAYIGLCFAYGSLNVVQAKLPQEALATVLTGVLTASAFLHFYFDGFIWKLREPGTRAGLGLAVGASERVRPAVPALVHGLKWAALFGIPLGLMAATSSRALPEDERMLALSESLPNDAGSQRNRAIVLRQRGDLEGAVAAARHARDLAAASPDEETARRVNDTLAGLLVEHARAEARASRALGAAALLGEAIALDPAAADRLSDEAASLIEAGDAAGAEGLCRLVVRAAPFHGPSRLNLAVALAAQGRLPEAHVHALEAVRLMPRDPRPQPILDAIRAGIEQGARR